MTSKIDHGAGAVYEERLVAFLDILGFSNLVKQSADDIEKQRKLYEFLQQYSKSEHAEKVFAGFGKGDGNGFDDGDIEALKALYDYRFTQFSDSFVFSVKAEQISSVQYFPLLIGQLMQHALDLGFLVRGGVAKGLMVHEEDGPAFGPAFIQAYRIESGQAVFGRAVLSKEAFGCISHSGNDSAAWIDKGLDGEYEITIASFLRQKFSSSISSTKRVPALNEAIQKVVRMLDALESTERDCVGGKYRYVLSRLQNAEAEAE
jgi:hypothetical protein